MTGVRDRVIVVTGAGGGLGREYALLLARSGAKVIVNDLGGARDGTGSGQEMADKVVAEITEAGGQAVADYHSVATEEGGAAVVATALESFGRIDGVVNNAGILRDVSFHKMTTAQWDAVVQVHLYGAYHVTRAAWPHLREQRHGRVVVAASNTGLYGNFGQANYGAAKLGMVGLINSLAIEGRKYGIFANAVAPLAVTRMTEDVTPPELLGRLHPAHVAPVVGHLVSDECADTGTVLIVGGGRCTRVQLFESRGVTFTEVPTIEQVTERFAEIVDMTGAVPGVNAVG